MRHIILYVAAALLATAARAAAPADSTRWNINVRAGYALGGTIPTDFPTEMRSLNSFSPKLSYRFGVTAERHVTLRHSLEVGLYIERRGFKSDVSMRQYEITLDQGGERIHGPFTGKVNMEIVQTGLTLPVMWSWKASQRLKLKVGPYLSYISDRKFQGYAYGEKVYDADGNWNGGFDAYIRRDEIRGEKVEIGNVFTDANGNAVDKRGTFNGPEFDEYLRHWQYGLDFGADYFLTGNWGLFADLTYGLNSAFNGKEGNPVSMPLHPIYFMVGGTYRIK